MNEEEKQGKPESGKEGLKRYYALGITLFLVIAAGSVFFLAMSRISQVIHIAKAVLRILEPIVFGFIIAYLMAPMVRFLERRFDPVCKKLIKSKTKAENLAKNLGIFLTLILVFALIVILIIMIIPELVENITNLVNSLPDQINHMSDVLAGYMAHFGMDPEGITEFGDLAVKKLNEWVQKDMLGNATVWFGRIAYSMKSFVSVAFNLILGLVVAIYVLGSRRTFKRQLKQIIYALFSGQQARMLIDTLHESNRIFSNFISGKMLDSLIIGIICFFGMGILRMPYMLLVSVIIGVTNIIPFFGPYLGAIPCTILILLVSPLKGLIFVIFILVLQQVDGNIIGPRILGDSTGLSAFWVVFAILLFGGVFGVIGMLFGVPVFAAIYRIGANVIDYLLRKKGLSEIADLSEKGK